MYFEFTVFSQFTKQLLSNFENISDFEAQGLFLIKSLCQNKSLGFLYQRGTSDAKRRFD